MSKLNSLSIIVDASKQLNHEDKSHLYSRHPLENMLLASRQQGLANDLAKDLGLGSGHYLILSPVHFHSTHNDVLITGLADRNCQQLMFSALKTFVNKDGFELYLYDKHLWLLKVENMPDLQSEILAAVVHQSLKPFLDQWPLAWRQWLTEVQMLFASHSLSQGLGVWIWGQGQMNASCRFLTRGGELLFNVPKHLLINNVSCLQDQDVLLSLVQHLSELEPLSKKFRRVHYYWQNTDYWQHTPSLLEQLIRWWQHKCK